MFSRQPEVAGSRPRLSREPYVTRHLRLAATLIVLAFPLLGCAALSAPLPHRGAALVCGVERWPIKTLADEGARRVNLTPVPTSVDELLQLPVPATVSQAPRPEPGGGGRRGQGEDSAPAAAGRNQRAEPVELTTYQVTARLVEARYEDNGDVSLVLASLQDPRRTMIAAFPDAPVCTTGAAAVHVEAMQQARKAVIETVGVSPLNRSVRASGTAEVVGVGFFDAPPGAEGAAPSGVELHPILRFTPASPPAS
jgi:hypothetical protein